MSTPATGYCGSTKCSEPAVSPCLQCQGSFCSTCFAQHSCVKSPRTANFRILAVNDIYAIEGFAKVQQFLEKKRKGRHSMVCVNGDFLGGSALAVRTQGHALVAIMNHMKVDNVCIGNHEFDYDAKGLTSCMAASKFRWFGSNIVNTTDGRVFEGVTDTHTFTVPFGPPGQETDASQGITVGMFGVCTAATPSLSYPGPNVKFLDVIATAKACVDKLRAQGAQVIIALTHVSLHQDREIAKHVEGIHLLLGGHDHIPFAITEGNSLVLKFGQNGEHLGIVDLEMTLTHDDKITVHPSFQMLSTATTAPCPEVMRIAHTFRNEDAANQEELAVVTNGVLSSLTAEGRNTGCTFGYLIADAFLAHHKADLGMINGGFMRGDKKYPPGTVLTTGTIKEELPFPREVVLVSLLGRDLLQAIEEELSYLPAHSGSFPHFSSGWILRYNPQLAVGSRVISLQYKDAVFEQDRLYNVAMTLFMAQGGDKCVSFTKGTIVSPPNQPTAGAVVVTYLKNLRDSQPCGGQKPYELEVCSHRMFVVSDTRPAVWGNSWTLPAPSSSRPPPPPPHSRSMSDHSSNLASPQASAAPTSLSFATAPASTSSSSSSSSSSPSVTSAAVAPSTPKASAQPSSSESKTGNDNKFPSDDNQFRHGLTNACTHLAVTIAKHIATHSSISKHQLSQIFLATQNPAIHGQMADILENDPTIELLTEAAPGSGFKSTTNVEWNEAGLKRIFCELAQTKLTTSCPLTFGGYTLCLHHVVRVDGSVSYLLVDTHNVDGHGALILESVTPEPLLQHLRKSLPNAQLGIHGGMMEYAIFRVVENGAHTTMHAVHRRPESKASPLPSRRPKACPVCTLENDGARTVCEACNHKLGGSNAL